MSRQIQLRRGTASDWTSSNPTLAQGEIGYETDTNKFKIGNGSSAWSALSYFTQSQSGSDLVSAINGSAAVIDDDNIASTIARDSEVSSAISTHAGNATAHHSNTNDPTASEKSALAGTSGTPSGTNKFVTNDDSRMTNARTPSSHGNEAHSSTFITGAGVTYEQLNSNGDIGSSASTLCAGNDSRLSDARTPVAHAHGNITNTGYLGSTAALPLITGTAGIIQAGSFGSASGTFCQGNDARLSDARTPTSHVHGNITNAGAIGTTADLPVKTTTSGVLTVGAFGTGATDFAAGNHAHSGTYEPAFSKNTAFNKNFGSAAGDVCQGNDSRLSNARTPTSHSHGNITNGGLIGTTANLPIITGTGGILQAGAFGTGATDFCVGNDARLSDSRTPTSHTHGNITDAGAIGSTSGLPIVTTTSGVLTTGSFGSAAGTFCAGDDTRLVTNAKQADRPFVFQTGHTAWATGLSNEEIGRIQLQTGETLYIKRVEIQIKGGGTSSSLSVNAYDSTNTTQIASQTAGGVNTTGGNSGSAALVLIRLTNSVGSTQNASVYISGWIRS